MVAAATEVEPVAETTGGPEPGPLRQRQGKQGRQGKRAPGRPLDENEGNEEGLPAAKRPRRVEEKENEAPTNEDTHAGQGQRGGSIGEEAPGVQRPPTGDDVVATCPRSPLAESKDKEGAGEVEPSDAVMEDSGGDVHEFFGASRHMQGKMQQIFGDRWCSIVQNASAMLSQMDFELDGASVTFESVYEKACIAQLDGHTIRVQLTACGVLGNSGTLAPALRVHPTGCSTMQSRPTLVYILVRMSPRTGNDGYSQVVRIIMALFCLAMKGVGDYEVHPIIFASPEVKRDESHKSGGIQQLFQALRITPDDRNVLVLANDVRRISSEPLQVNTFERSVKALQSNAEVKTLREFEMHLVRAALTLATEASQRRNICATIANHNNAGKFVDIDQELMQTRESVKQLASDIESDIESFEPLLSDAAERGANHPVQNQLARLWRKALKSVDQKQSTAEEAAAEFISGARKELSQSLKKDGKCRKKRIVLYLRDSPRKQCSRKMAYGQPLDQLASCMARAKIEYGDAVFSECDLIIFHDAGKERSTKCNAAFAKLLSLVVGGGLDDCQRLDDVIFPDTARISDCPNAIELLDAVFAHKDVGARRLFSRLVGQNHSTVAQKEGQRKKSLENVVDERKRKVEAQRKVDIPCDEMRAVSDVLQTISGMLSFPGIVIPREKWDRQAEVAQRNERQIENELDAQLEAGAVKKRGKKEVAAAKAATAKETIERLERLKAK